MTNTLRIATYNLHSCVGGDRRYDPERTLRVLEGLNADILGLQEVGGYLHDGFEQIHFFEQKLGMEAVAGSNLFRRGAQFGNAVLARGKIEEMRLVNLTVLPFEPRSAVDASVDLESGRLRVIATHLGLFPGERHQQVDRLAAVLENNRESLTILMGDFNIFGPERTILRRIGAPRPMPRLYSFPARWPLMSLDRIWTMPNDRLKRLVVHRTPLSRIASDHLPVVAEIDVAPVATTAAESLEAPYIEGDVL